MSRFLLILLFFCAPVLGCAGKFAEHTETIAIFERAFIDETIYRRADCDANVHRLLARLRDAKVDLSAWKVWYLFGPAGMSVRQPRDPLSEWGYHAVVYGDGVIYDLDFTRAPRSLPAGAYLLENIVGEGRDEDARTRILERHDVVELPAEDFLKRFSPDRSDDATHRAFRRWAGEFPPSSLKDVWARFVN